MGPAARYLGRGVGSLVCLALVTPLITPTAAQSATRAGTGPDKHARYVPGAPVPLQITTDGGVPIESKDDYVQGSMLLEGVTRPLEIRGRGNSTWTWPKKPYKIKLETEASLLGLPAHDEWVLLANYADRSALRTFLAMGLASATRLAWSPHTRFVDVVLNGTPLGLYLLTDQVEQGTSRVDLPEDGFLLEVDKRFRQAGDRGFWTERGIPVAFKDPDEPNLAERQRVRGAVHRFEKALYGRDFTDPETGYAAHVDVASVIDWYLVEELFLNQDSNFASSVHFTWVPKIGFEMGPVWDFDLSAGTKWKGTSSPVGYYTRGGSRHWISRMFEDPAFSAAVRDRWTQLRPVVDAMVAQIPAAAGVIRSSALNNLAIWPPSTRPELVGSAHADTFDGEISYLSTWLSQRIEWMSRDEAIFGIASRRIKERERVIDVPVRILGTQVRPVEVGYSWLSGRAKPGTDFTMVDGTLVFGPGERVKTFPVTILGDRQRERGETITLQLTGTAAGPRLGHPSLVTLTIRRSDFRR